MEKKRKLIIVCSVLILIVVLILVVVKLQKSPLKESDYGDGDNMTGIYDENEDYYEDEIDESESEPLHKTEIPEGYIGIYSIEDFDYIPTSPQYSYILMNDIDINGIETPDKGYEIDGVFDGNNYTLSNYSSTHPLFDTAYRIINLNMDNANITNKADDFQQDKLSFAYDEEFYIKYTAIIANKLNNFEEDDNIYEMENCHVNGKIIIDISDYKHDIAKVFHNQIHIGGLVASCLNSVAITNCSFDGDIEINCSNTKREYEYDLFVGGICGKAFGGSLLFCCNTSGNFKMKSKINEFNVGGICGQDYGSIQFCGNKINIDSNAEGYYGGVLGYADWHGVQINNSYNSGNISISNMNQNIDLSSLFIITGGITGDASGSITDCYNTGNIDGVYVSGGIIGISDTQTITNVYNTGKVTCHKLITDDSPNGISYKGAIAGKCSASNSYGVLENCYYTNNDINAVSNNSKFPYVKHLSEAESKEQAAYSGFDFEGKWTMSDSNNSHPILVGITGQE